jgi:F-type H+-transporting ATPase subunit delta
MPASTVAQSYGAALLQVACSRDVRDKVWQDIRDIRPHFEPGKPIRHFLDGPQIPTSKKKDILDRVFASSIDSLLQDYLLMLVDKNRTDVVYDSLEAFHLLAEEQDGITEGVVLSAHPLSEAVRRRMREELERVCGLKFVLDFRIKPDLIGGVVIRYKDVLLDGSLQSKLKEIRTCLGAVVVN